MLATGIIVSSLTLGLIDFYLYFSLDKVRFLFLGTTQLILAIFALKLLLITNGAPM